MIDLNSEEFKEKEVKIVNDGKAGLAEGLKIVSAEKKQPTDKPGSPDWKVNYEDDNGAKINTAFYYGEGDKVKYTVNRAKEVTNALLGKDFKYPAVESLEDAVDKLLELVNKNKNNNKVDLFLTYGTTGYPKEYLNTRYFQFIRAAGDDSKRLTSRDDDAMERVVADQPETNVEKETKDDEWLDM